jgi:hypothetical protein
MQEQQPEKDYFAFYIAGVTLLIITTIFVVKLSENEKFAPIKAQLEEEATQMNIRVLSSVGE